ncbi:MAG: hypothetical protein WDW38_005145 [Sanguina aurantia]
MPNMDVDTGGRFEMIRALGAGAFGEVKLVREVSTQTMLAMKVLKRRDVDTHVVNEIINHSLLRHPHVVQFREMFLTQDHVCILMEYANGGSLFDMVSKERKLREPLARWFFQQLILAMDYCHKMGVANRDIKLENLLLHNEEGLAHPLLKICDLGYSKADSRSLAKSQVGTLSYMAPEVIRSFNNTYNAKVADVWSCGVVLYVILYGSYPFDSNDDLSASEALKARKMLERMEGEAYNLKPDVTVSADGLGLLKRLLCPSPATRITVSEIIGHPWFQRKLPAQTREMNDFYVNLPLPPQYQTAEQIRLLMQQAHAPVPGGLLH